MANHKRHLSHVTYDSRNRIAIHDQICRCTHTHPASQDAASGGLGGHDDASFESRLRSLRSKMFQYWGISFVLYWAAPIVASIVFSDFIQTLWWLTPGLSFLATSLFYFAALSFSNNRSSYTIATGMICCATAVYPLASLMVAIPSLKSEDTEFDWLSPNMWVVFNLFHYCYLFGYSWRVFESQINYCYRRILLPCGAGVYCCLLIEK